MAARLTLTLGVLALMVYVASAQSQRPADASDAINALVAELRAVRAELSDASQRSLRFQLLLDTGGGLGIQETRIVDDAAGEGGVVRFGRDGEEREEEE